MWAAALLVFVTSGCTTVKDVTGNPKYMGGFQAGQVWKLRTETILTSEHQPTHRLVFDKADKLQLVAAGSSSAFHFYGSNPTNPVPISEIGRLASGTRVRLVKMKLESVFLIPFFTTPQSLTPYVEISDGEHTGVIASAAYLSKTTQPTKGGGTSITLNPDPLFLQLVQEAP
jgi:hypothetical protein